MRQCLTIAEIGAEELRKAPAPISARYMKPEKFDLKPKPKTKRPRSNRMSSQPWLPAIPLGNQVTITCTVNGVWLAHNGQGRLVYAATRLFDHGLMEMLAKGFKAEVTIDISVIKLAA